MGVSLEMCTKKAAAAPSLDDSVDPFVDDWFLAADDIDNISEAEYGWPNQDGQIAGSGQIEHLISKSQLTHDQATQLGVMKKKVIQKPITFVDVRKKRQGTPLDDEEKKERKRIADQKHRAKNKTNRKIMEDELQAHKSEVECLKSANDSYATQNEMLQENNKILKAQVKDIQSQLQTANSKIERSEGAFEELNKEKNSNAQKLLHATTENGKLQNENYGLKDRVRKMEEELRGVKGINASPMEGNVTVANDLQIGASNTSELQHKIYSGVQQLLSMFAPNHIQGFPMEQEQLGKEDNGRLGFEGDGRPFIGTLVSEIQGFSMEEEQLGKEDNERLGFEGVGGPFIGTLVSEIQGFPMEQEQLGQEDNRRLGLEGDGRPPIGTLVSEIQSMDSQMAPQANAELEARNGSAEAAKQMLEVHTEMLLDDLRLSFT